MHRAMILLAALSLAGCDAITGAGEPFEVEVDAEVSSAGWTADEMWRCSFTLTARATGEDGASAEWATGTVEWREPDGSPIASGTFTPTDLVDIFGASRIRAGETQGGERFAERGRIFSLALTFRYDLPDAERRSVFLAVPCHQP